MNLCVLSGGEGEKTRKRIASEVLHEALEALRSDIDIAVYDSSNATCQRRKWLADAVASSGLHAQVQFVINGAYEEPTMLIERWVEFVRP